MSEHVIKLPDVGEGVAEAEIVEWFVKPGDVVREDDMLAAVMTDKATVEIPSPVEGKVSWVGGDIGEIMAVGSPLVRIEVAGGDGAAPATKAETKAEAKAEPEKPALKKEAKAEKPAPKKEEKPAPQPASKTTAPKRAPRSGPPRPAGEKPLASPAVRRRARELGADLRMIAGSGPAGRITHEDLDAWLEGRGAPAARGRGLFADTSVSEIKVIGLRRRIAEKMALSKSRIPHITYVEEVDVTALEELRATLNSDYRGDRTKLTVLPFLMRAMVKAIAEQPEINSLFDDEAGVIHQHGGVHIGIATQTDNGLMVPVVRHTEARDIWDCAAEVVRLADASRDGSATRDELSGSTITITSLGPIGGIVTTPVINHPEVAIVGVNKIAMRPVWNGSDFVPRKMMNLSCGFDHRVIDGWNAATFVQRLKTLLETPALIFMED